MVMFPLQQEDTSLLIEFTKIITTLEQEFEGVEPEFTGIGNGSSKGWSLSLQV